MAQFARPNSDQNTVWNPIGGPSTRWDCLNEEPFSDTDYIDSAVPADGQLQRCGLSSVGDPASSTGHIMRVRAGKNAAGGNTVNLAVSLWQGPAGTGTLIASIPLFALGAGFFATTYTLSAAEADAITDYGNLSVQFIGSGGNNVVFPANSRSARVSWFAFETPDAAAISKAGSDSITVTDTRQAQSATVSASDTMTVSDLVSALARASSVSDFAAATDAKSALAAGSTVADDATASDAGSFAASLVVQDSATGQESVSIVAAQEAQDLITAADAGSFTASLAAQDSASANEVSALLASFEVSDSFVATDLFDGLAVGVAVVDTASASEQVAIELAVADAFDATDSMEALLAHLAVSDEITAMDVVPLDVVPWHRPLLDGGVVSPVRDGAFDDPLSGDVVAPALDGAVEAQPIRTAGVVVVVHGGALTGPARSGDTTTPARSGDLPAQ